MKAQITETRSTTEGQKSVEMSPAASQGFNEFSEGYVFAGNEKRQAQAAYAQYYAHEEKRQGRALTASEKEEVGEAVRLEFFLGFVEKEHRKDNRLNQLPAEAKTEFTQKVNKNLSVEDIYAAAFGDLEAIKKMKTLFENSQNAGVFAPIIAEYTGVNFETEAVSLERKLSAEATDLVSGLQERLAMLDDQLDEMIQRLSRGKSYTIAFIRGLMKEAIAKLEANVSPKKLSPLMLSLARG